MQYFETHAATHNCSRRYLTHHNFSQESGINNRRRIPNHGMRKHTVNLTEGSQDGSARYRTESTRRPPRPTKTSNPKKREGQRVNPNHKEHEHKYDKNSKVPSHIECFNCGKNHFKRDCPTLPKRPINSKYNHVLMLQTHVTRAIATGIAKRKAGERDENDNPNTQAPKPPTKRRGSKSRKKDGEMSPSVLSAGGYILDFFPSLEMQEMDIHLQV